MIINRRTLSVLGYNNVSLMGSLLFSGIHARICHILCKRATSNVLGTLMRVYKDSVPRVRVGYKSGVKLATRPPSVSCTTTIRTVKVQPVQKALEMLPPH